MRDHGGQKDALARSLGVELPQEPHFDFSASLNPLGMPPMLGSLPEVWASLVTAYPLPDADGACVSLAQAHGLDAGQVLCGNGSMELMALALQAWRPMRAHLVRPCWSGYQEVCRAAGVECQESATVARLSETLDELQTRSAVILGSPANPDGWCVDPKELLDLCRRNPEALFLLDLAFDDFLWSPHNSPWWNLPNCPGNLVRIQSLTKFFCIPGMRLGFLAVGTDGSSRSLFQRMQRHMLPWSVNALAQWCAPRLYSDASWCDQSRNFCRKQEQQLVQILSAAGLRVRACSAWVLAEPSDHDVLWWQSRLLERGVVTRRVCQPGITDCLRFGLQTMNAHHALEKALCSLI